jgi:aerobic carbon-monoxide dehydrogenase small subunit
VTEQVEIVLLVNGREHAVEIDPDERLVDTLRTRLGLTGVREGCGEGECGACTVLMDGLAVNSCLVLTYQARGRQILTIEGLSTKGRPDPLQETFVKHHAIQCGYCTPGMILSSKGLLLRNPRPSEPEVKEAIAGNLCRCTGYVNIVAAVRDAAKDREGEG